MEGPIVLSVFVMLSRLLARVVLPPRMFWRNGGDKLFPTQAEHQIVRLGATATSGRTPRAARSRPAQSGSNVFSHHIRLRPVRLPALTKATCSREDFGMLVRSVLPRLIIVLASGFCLVQTRAADAPVDFKRDIEPIFVKRCSECHGPDKKKGGLRLDSKAEAMKGGKSGKAAIAPGKSSESEMIRRVTTDDMDDRMPPKGDPLDKAQIAALRAWMDQG